MTPGSIKFTLFETATSYYIIEMAGRRRRPYGAPNVTKIRERHHVLYPVILRGPCHDVVRKDPAILRDRNPVILRGPSHDVVRKDPAVLRDRNPVILRGLSHDVVIAIPQ